MLVDVQHHFKDLKVQSGAGAPFEAVVGFTASSYQKDGYDHRIPVSSAEDLAMACVAGNTITFC